jgi:hypothetical protein
VVLVDLEDPEALGGLEGLLVLVDLDLLGGLEDLEVLGGQVDLVDLLMHLLLIMHEDQVNLYTHLYMLLK